MRGGRNSGAIPEEDRGGGSREDGEREWQEGGKKLRPNQKETSGSGADEQGNEHADKPPPLRTGRGPSDEVAGENDNGRGRSSRKDTFHMQCAHRRALHPHGQGPQANEDTYDVTRRLAIIREPDGQENSMGNQRYP